jgi:hypothetical protein
MKNFSDNMCKQNRNTFYFQQLSSKLVSLLDNVEKVCRAGQATDDNMAHALCMSNNYAYKHTLRICNTYCFSTATTVARPRLNVTLYVHCLACSWITCTFRGMITYVPTFVQNSVGFYDCPINLYVTRRSPKLLRENGKVRFISTGFDLVRTDMGLTGKASVTKHNRPQHTSKGSSVQALLNSLWN